MSAQFRGRSGSQDAEIRISLRSPPAIIRCRRKRHLHMMIGLRTMSETRVRICRGQSFATKSR